MSTSAPWWPPLLAAAITAIVSAFVLVNSHIRGQRWKQAEFVRQAFQERYDSPGARNASSLLYWGDRHIPLWDSDESNRWERVTDEEAAKAILPYIIHPFQFVDPDFKRDKRRIALNDSFVDLLWRLDHVRASAEAARVTDVHEVIRELGELLDNSGICSRLAPLDRLILPAFRLMIAWRKMNPLIEFFDTHGFDVRVTPADTERLRDRFPELNWGMLDTADLTASLPGRNRPHWRIESRRRRKAAAAAWLAERLRQVRDNIQAVLQLQRASEPSSSRSELYHYAAGPHGYSAAIGRRDDRTIDLVIHATGGDMQSYRLDPADHQSYLGLFRLLARRLGTRMPKSDRGAVRTVQSWSCKPLLTENASPTIMYGYGDPSILREDGCKAPLFYLVSTSNDAPNSFPILRSSDLKSWSHVGFIFPDGQKPAWALSEVGGSDFWAPQISRIGSGYVACFTARDHNKVLSVGLARADHPVGPYVPLDQPIVGNGAIDGRVVVDDGKTYLAWKLDNNDRWPSVLVAILIADPSLVGILFDDERDRKTACLTITLWPWIGSLIPMQRFFALQPLIEAVTSRFDDMKRRLSEIAEGSPNVADMAAELVEMMATPVYIQEIDIDRNALVGPCTEIIRNDQPWEGHVVEAASLEKYNDTYFLFYSGNDFSTPDYGIGIAVSKSLLGPYQKADAPLLGSSAEWTGPGHPAITVSPAGRHVMLLHAYKPHRVGYKVFRALLLIPITFQGNKVSLVQAIGDDSGV